MAFKEKLVLTCFLFIWLSFIKVSSFVIFDEEKIPGTFNKNARRPTTEYFGRGDEQPKSGQQGGVGRIIIGQYRASNPHGESSDGVVSDIRAHSRYDQDVYQSDDPGWLNLQPLWGHVYGLNTLYTPKVNKLLGMKPTVDCVEDFMKITVHGHEASFGSHFLIDRGSIPPLPWSQLPSECGHRFLRTWGNLVFIVPFDGCYVSQERDAFVLPLLWSGLPVKLSCTSSRHVPTVSCYTSGMIVRLHGGVSENLKIKIKEEWQPLLKVSARCGYTLTSHPEGVVIYAPHMPCTEPKDGKFTLSMAMEREFNLSCPVMSHNPPMQVLYAPHENDTATSAFISPPTTVTTPTKTVQSAQSPRSTTSSPTKFPPFPYFIPAKPDFKPIPPNYPFLLSPPNMSSSVVPLAPSVDISRGPQAPVYQKRPQALHPWYNFSPDSSQSPAVHYPRDPLLPPAKAPEKSLASLKPTIDAKKPIVPVHWASMFPPNNLAHPLYPGKPEFVAPSSSHVPSWPDHSETQPKPPELHDPLKPGSTPPIPAPTRQIAPQLFHPWYRPVPPHLSEVPHVVSISGTVAPSSTTHSVKSEDAPQAFVRPHPSVVKHPPTRLHFDFTPNMKPFNSPPKCREVVCSLAPIKVPHTPISSSHAHSFRCPTFCPGPPSISYHHHNHHHFNHPFSTSKLDFSSRTKITSQMLSSTGISTGSNWFPFVQGMGYYGPLASNSAAVPLPSDNAARHYFMDNTNASDNTKPFNKPTLYSYNIRKSKSAAASPQSITKPLNIASVIHPLRPLLSRPLQNLPVADSRSHSDQISNPPVHHPKVQWYTSRRVHHRPPVLVSPNNDPSGNAVQRDISSKLSIPPANDKNVYTNYWYQANPNVKQPMSDSPQKDSSNQMPLPQSSINHNSFESSPQPERTPGTNAQSFHPLMQIRNSVPVRSPQLSYPQSGQSVAPVFRDAKLLVPYWELAARSK